MWRMLLSLLAIGYLPGALIFRLPLADRPRRAALPADERVFWAIVLSLIVSSVVSLGLAASGWYQFDRLLGINGMISVLVGTAGGRRLRLGSAAPRPTWTALIPAALVVLGLWLNFFVPPSEYVMGGKDPGTYMNEGIQIAQRGSLVTTDRVAAEVPPSYRDLFFPYRGDPSYYSNRFMGFFLLDPAQGTVVGQFPHLYPVWIAIAYGVNGLTGARWVIGLWAVLGLVAVYFAGARLMGRAAAAAGAALLAVHVAQVWYSRYPNAELVMQPLIFAALLAFVRAEVDGDRFFAPVAAVLLALSVAAHFTAVLAIAAVAAAAGLASLGGHGPRRSFVLPLVAATAVAVVYLAVFLPPYFAVPVGFVRELRPIHVALLVVAATSGLALMHAARRYPAVAASARARAPVALGAAVLLFAGYALLVRSAGEGLAPHDADALRTFTSFYLSPLGLATALAGFVIVSRRSFWSGVPFLLTVAIFSFFFFYKIRIVPEHFWAARRFLTVILPGALLLVGAAAFCDVSLPQGWRPRWSGAPVARGARSAVGLALVTFIGWQFVTATRPVLRHVEYAGLIPRLEQLAERFGEHDLVLVESRGASDVHVLALPLAYIYARNVLVFAATNPDKDGFRKFLTWARERYERVFFVGGGGTELMSRTMTIEAIAGERFQIPEYESAWNAYPRSVRHKEFDFGIYEFLPRPADASGFQLDVGTMDDLYVRRFHAKERHQNGMTFRWTRDESYVSILGTAPDHRELTLWLDNGGRPVAAGPAAIEVFLNERPLGMADVIGGLNGYRFSIAAELAAAIARSDDAAQLRIRTRTWNPGKILGVGDDRELGVMVDRIELK